MAESYWNKESDPYQYPSSSVLRNIPDIREQVALDVFEQRATALRLDEVIDIPAFGVHIFPSAKEAAKNGDLLFCGTRNSHLLRHCMRIIFLTLNSFKTLKQC